MRVGGGGGGGGGGRAWVVGEDEKQKHAKFISSTRLSGTDGD